MKIHNLSCKQCGASISYDGNSSVAFCQYCGAKLIIESTEEEAYQDEKGRMRAKTENALQDADALEKYIQAVSKNSAILQKYDMVTAQLDSAKLVEKALIFLRVFFQYVLPGLLAYGLMGIAETFGQWLVALAVSVFLFPLCEVCYFTFCKVTAGSIEKNEMISKKLSEDLCDSDKEMEEYREYAETIPAEMCNQEDIEWMCRVLRAGKAENISQAIILLEEKKEEDYKRALQEEQVRLERERLRQQEMEYRQQERHIREMDERMQELEENRSHLGGKKAASFVLGAVSAALFISGIKRR